jgi:tRNA A-37 threonylcarbamoyl transferase component Bud32/tetratricopeptide (TPR) repeat protein
LSYLQVIAGNLFGQMYNDLGWSDQAWQVLQETLPQAQGQDELQAMGPHLAQSARALAGLGRKAEAGAHLQRLLALVEHHQYDHVSSIMPLLFGCGWFAAQANNGDESLDDAKTNLHLLERLFNQTKSSVAEVALQEARGILALAEGNHEEAIRHYRAAAGGWQKLARQYDQARALHGLAQALMHANDTVQAGVAVAQGLEIIETLAGELDEADIKAAFLNSALVQQLHQAGSAVGIQTASPKESSPPDHGRISHPNLPVKAEVLASEPSSMPKPSFSSAPANQRYIQDKLIATGGMGEVYLGRDTQTGRPVAIKRLRSEWANSNVEVIQRFHREGEALRRLDHPNIVKILDSLEREGQPVIVMEFVSGGTLQDLLAKAPQLPLERVLSIGLELADALARVHHLGILHRDIKPGNVLLAEDGTPRLTDFGVAYLARPDNRLTQEGQILGTTVYLSPEAWRGETLDARSDIWSFGAMLFEMLAGQPPFTAENPVAIMSAILNNPLPELSRLRPDAPPALVELISHMLMKDRNQRLDSMRQVAAGLEVIRRTQL